MNNITITNSKETMIMMETIKLTYKIMLLRATEFDR